MDEKNQYDKNITEETYNKIMILTKNNWGEQMKY